MGLIAPKKWFRKLRGLSKTDEVKMLEPVALAGASRSCNERSKLCSTFATTITSQELTSRDKSHSDGAVLANWKQCHNCDRKFLKCASKYADFCSLDCKSASLHRGSYS
ncbi:TPA: hypothetical protein N0F65_003904 [Lagenidium giganteum]|uniref:Uncharacterized protein n=1 Tax=Lagenidium giganteum TaxID=4803 RepID=A0AAV2ZCI3_9STRA|nr:TPA: hypothetical protein N0F65_003904 [Lagenidium giganteum]